MILLTLWRTLRRLVRAVTGLERVRDELLGIVHNFAKAADRITHAVEQQHRATARDVLAVGTAVGSVQQRVETLIARVPDAPHRQREFEAWAADVLQRARLAAAPAKVVSPSLMERTRDAIPHSTPLPGVQPKRVTAMAQLPKPAGRAKRKPIARAGKGKR